jgi:8-oxo-dGTP pyrophosphatase MutT (NUDIX family)
MIHFHTENGTFFYRAAGILRHQGRILLMKNQIMENWLLPGGRCEMHEDSAGVVQRELMEETGLTVEVDALRFVTEYFFTEKERRYHQLGFYYEISLVGEPHPEWGQTFYRTEADQFMTFQWFDEEALAGVRLYPSGLKSRLFSPSQGLEHLLLRDSW